MLPDNKVQNVLVETYKYLAVSLARKNYFQAQHVAFSKEQQGLQEVCAQTGSSPGLFYLMSHHVIYDNHFSNRSLTGTLAGIYFLSAGTVPIKYWSLINVYFVVMSSSLSHKEQISLIQIFRPRHRNHKSQLLFFSSKQNNNQCVKTVQSQGHASLVSTRNS